ncbi:MAG: hypothetical protein C0616_05715 [Desulfuromonas sp.]|nr:MAG: hypothetical protein C0616_05715 [Desulfuromonas sp.]
MNDFSDQELMTALASRLDKQKGDIDTLQRLNDELARANEKLRESEAVKSNFLSNIRNEIVNPLSAILGLAQQCMGKDQGGDCGQVGGRIFSEAYRLNYHLQNIFAAAELEAGEVEFAPARVNASAMVVEMVDELENLVLGKNLTFDIQAVDDCFIFTDGPKLNLALMNILANAAEFSPKGGCIQVKLNADEWGFLISVHDDGPGIPQESLGKIFDRFRQLDEGSTKAYPGQGLGLSMTKAMVEILGGEIEVSSLSGQGCTVRVVLPSSVTTGHDDDGDDGTYLSGNVQLF